MLVTLTCVCRSKLNQRQAYNGHERATDIIFNGIVLKNGLTGNLVASQIGKRNDYTTLPESGLLDNLQRVAWFNGQPFFIYGDPVYLMRIHLRAPYRPGNFTEWNKGDSRMAEQSFEIFWNEPSDIKRIYLVFSKMNPEINLCYITDWTF